MSRHVRGTALLLVALGFGGVVCTTPQQRGALAQAAMPAVAADEALLDQGQLAQLLAPIALYPDALLMQVLMAATYPLEVVQATRWLGQGSNARLQGEPLAKALESQAWDPSVKSLVPFPDVLKLLNDQLDWTQRLGDAVLAQQQDVLNAVQALRARADAAGTLSSGPQQVVTRTPYVAAAPSTTGAQVPPPQEVIVIQPAQPDQVFVPVYDPGVVYGAWPYPSYPPAYYPPPPAYGLGSALLTGMAFAGGVAVVSSLWGWGRPGWGRGNVDIDVNRFNSINVNRAQISTNNWQHDVTHRQGVAYRNQEVNTRYRGGNAANRGQSGGIQREQSRDQLRGRLDQAEHGGSIGNRPGGAGERPNLGDRRVGNAAQGPGHRTADGNRPALADRRPEGRGGERPSLAGRQPGGGERPAIPHAASGRPTLPARAAGGAPPALAGMGDGGRVRAEAARGQASRQAPVQRPAAARGGGGDRAASHAGGRAAAGGRRAAHDGGGRHGR